MDFRIAAISDFRTAAISRVENDDRLYPYRGVLLEYDWPNRDEHDEWVATASVEELVEWAIVTDDKGGDMKVKVEDVAFHRNGIGGEPFAVVLFTNHDGKENREMLGIVFDAPGHVAVLDAELLFDGVIAFGENSHRGDVFEPQLRAMVRAAGGSDDEDAG